MYTAESIPPEVRASVEANALFDALRRGDYAAAAKAQERLRACERIPDYLKIH